METTTISQNIVSVTNRNNGYTTYIIPELNVKRTFGLNETKKIPLSELNTLKFQPGGEYMLRELLIVNDKSALDALDIETEPEYFYTEKEVEQILLSNTQESLDQLEDALNFAPEGVIELIKQIAVSKEIPDTRKRDLITEKTGFSVNNAIMVNKVLEEEPKKEEKAETTRKAAPVKVADSAPARKASPVSTTAASPKYKVVSK